MIGQLEQIERGLTWPETKSRSFQSGFLSERDWGSRFLPRKLSRIEGVRKVLQEGVSALLTETLCGIEERSGAYCSCICLISA